MLLQIKEKKFIDKLKNRTLSTEIEYYLEIRNIF